MTTHTDLLKEYKKIMNDVLENKDVSLNKLHYYVIVLAKFIAIKELYAPKDIKNKIIYFDEIKDVHMIKPFSELAYYIKQQSNSYIKNNLKVELQNPNEDLETTIWIVNKVRDSIVHLKFVIDEQRNMLVIDNDASADPKEGYKLKCEIPISALDNIFNNIRLESNEPIQTALENFKQVLKQITNNNNIDTNSLISVGYFMLFFMDETRTIDYPYIDLNGMGPLVYTKHNPTYISKRDRIYNLVGEKLTNQTKIIDTYNKQKKDVIKDNVISCHLKFIEQIIEALGVLHEEALTFIRNGSLHVNLSINSSNKYNLVDKTDQRKIGFTKVGIFTTPKQIYNLTENLERNNLKDNYTIKDFLKNIKIFGYPFDKKIHLLMNEMYQLLFNEDIDENDKLDDYITKLKSEIKVKKLIKK